MADTELDLALQGMLYQAMASPHGLAIRVNDFVRVSQKLHSTRRKLSDPSLDALRIARSPQNPDGELWLYLEGKGPAENPIESPTR